MLEKIDACPFCGSQNTDISIKVSGGRKPYYHVTVYCKNCHCYGPRFISRREHYREILEEDQNAAILLWNKRKEN